MTENGQTINNTLLTLSSDVKSVTFSHKDLVNNATVEEMIACAQNTALSAMTPEQLQELLEQCNG